MGRKREMRIDDVRKLLAARCEEAGGLHAFARAHSIAVQYVWQVIHGRKQPSAKVCKALGIRPIEQRWEVVMGGAGKPRTSPASTV